MKEFKGTKGEWKVGLYPTLNHPHRTVCTNAGDEICTIHSDNEEVRANAKLIAASKDLLEALQKIYNIENHAFSLKGFDVNRLKSDIETAINKAL